MKKLILLVVLVLAGTSLNAQGFNWGATAGVNLSNIGGDDPQDPEIRTGLNIGVVGDLGISEDFSIQPEIRYSMRGWKEGEIKLKIDYIDIPVAADYEVVDGLSLQGGPLFGFVISDEVEVNGDNQGSIDGLETFNFGALIGAQYQFDNGLYLQARYDMGFIDLFDNFDAKPCNISFNLGYMFDFSGDTSE
jgi:hypothetical protein